MAGADSYGMPKTTLSDNGREFKNALFASVKQNFGIKPRFTAPYNPQGNGLCEKTNGVISTLIAKILDGRGGDIGQWDTRVEEAVFLNNTKLHSATGKTPFEMLYGKPRNSWLKMRLA